jgi:carboxypeptidase PM20D1
MKRAVAGLGIVLALFIIVIVFNTAAFKSRQERFDPVSIQYDPSRAFENLSKAIQIPTVAYDDKTPDYSQITAFHRFLERTFPLVHSTLKKEVVHNYSLLYTWKGAHEARKPVLLMGHMDVVPIEPGTEHSWKHPPFSGKIAGGFIWGRGALDDKACVMGILEAAEELLRKGYRPDRTVYFAFGHDEEGGGAEGGANIAKLLADRGVRLELALDEGGTVTEGVMKGIDAPVALVGMAEKGFLYLELSTESSGGHAAMPPRETALGILCNAIATLERRQFPDRLTELPRAMFEWIGPEMGLANRMVLSNLWAFGGILKRQLAKNPSTAAMLHTTIAPTMIQGSIKKNALPIRASAIINFRIMPGETMESVTGYVRDTIDDPRVTLKAVGLNNNPSPVSDISSPGFKTVHKTIGQMFPGAIVAPYLVMVRTDSRHYAPVADSVIRFMPCTMKPEDLARIHGTNERIALSTYETYIKFYMQFIKNADMK